MSLRIRRLNGRLTEMLSDGELTEQASRDLETIQIVPAAVQEEISDRQSL